MDTSSGRIALLFAVAMSTFHILPAKAQEPDEERSKELKEIVRAIGIDQSTLKDPFSAEYRRIRECDLGYIGEINSKNSYGAYTGWSYFAYAKDNSIAWVGEEPERLEAFANLWCTMQTSPPGEYIGVYKMTMMGFQMFGAGVSALASCVADIDGSGILVAHPYGSNCALKDDLIFGRVSGDGKIFRNGAQVGEILDYDKRKKTYSGKVSHPLGNDKRLKFKLKRKD